MAGRRTSDAVAVSVHLSTVYSRTTGTTLWLMDPFLPAEWARCSSTHIYISAVRLTTLRYSTARKAGSSKGLLPRHKVGRVEFNENWWRIYPLSPLGIPNQTDGNGWQWLAMAGYHSRAKRVDDRVRSTA
jgi:hypothetical protein